LSGPNGERSEGAEDRLSLYGEPAMPKPEPASANISLFYSYSHNDERYRNKLEKHLSNLKRQGFISEWHDRKISGGTEWKDQIERQLEAAKVILLLVSADFIHSDFCYSVELKRALERHESGEARVIPIIVRPCDWHSAPIGKLQALPKDGKAITKWRSQDEAYLNITEGIRKVVEELKAGTNPTEGQASLPKVTTHEEKPQFEEKFRVRLRGSKAANSAPPYSTGEPLRFEIDLTIVNIGRSPVFIVAAALKDPTGRNRLDFKSVCDEKEPLQPGGRRMGKLKLLHHKPFPVTPWSPRTQEQLFEHNSFVYKLLRFICQPGSAFHIETALGTKLVYPAVEVCDEHFFGWPYLFVPKDITDAMGTKTLKDFEDEERAAWEKAGAKIESPLNVPNRSPLSVEVLSFSYDELMNGPGDSIDFITPYPRCYAAEIAITNSSEHPISIKSISLTVRQHSYQPEPGAEVIRIEPHDYKRVDLTFPIEGGSAVASGDFELMVLPVLGEPIKIRGTFPLKSPNPDLGMRTSFPVVKVRKGEFEQFLHGSSDVATLWKPDNLEFEQFLNGIPCDVEELMTAIDLFAGQECDYVYVFNSNVDDPDGAWSQVIFDNDKLPEVKASDLSEYVVRSSMGKDFLYFACSMEEASNLQYTTLLPGGFDDGDDEGELD
jgi:hypothetical protein